MRVVFFPSFRGLTVLGGAISLLALFAGCATPPPPAPAAAKPAARPLKPVVIGEIAIVDEKKRFVLIDLASYLYVPEPGASLRSRNRSGETARLKASPEQKRPFIAADIVAGNPAVGDQVVR